MGFQLMSCGKKRNIDLKGGNEVSTELYMLSDTLPEELRDENEVATLIIRNGANFLLDNSDGANKLYNEQTEIDYDTMFFNPRQKKMMNKQARYNIVFGDEAQY